MKATVTRTLQAPQYAPVVMTLEEECTPETFTATLNRLADLIENTLRERYPQYAGVLPKVVKKEKPVEYTEERAMYRGINNEMREFKMKVEKVIEVYKGQVLVDLIKNSDTLSQLQSYYKHLDSDAAEQAYNDKLMELKSKVA
jgi:hypothetical protein